MLAFQASDPAQYGRVLLTPDGFLNRIVEYKDASEPERGITLCNGGCYAADAQKFFRWTAALKNDNAQKEYYLTDVPSMARAEGVKCAVALADEVSVLGVNSRAELAEAEGKFQARMRARLLAEGVGMTAPETVFFAYDTRGRSRCRDRALCRVRPRRGAAVRAPHPQPQPSGRRGRLAGRHYRSFCPSAPRRRKSALAPISAISWK